MSLFEGLNCVHDLFLGKEKVSLLEKCPHFRGVLRERLNRRILTTCLPVFVNTARNHNFSLSLSLPSLYLSPLSSVVPVSSKTAAGVVAESPNADKEKKTRKRKRNKVCKESMIV